MNLDWDDIHWTDPDGGTIVLHGVLPTVVLPNAMRPRINWHGLGIMGSSEEVDVWAEEEKAEAEAKEREAKKSKVPAVVHHAGTGRFQSVKKSDNSWLHSFLTKWNEASGVPILLNTSFNDREPIVETPTHAINCFLKTDIDYLYFPEYKLLVEKCQKIA